MAEKNEASWWWPAIGVVAIAGLLALTVSETLRLTRAPVPKTGNKAHDMLASLDERAREGVFNRMFTGSHERCGLVERTFYQGSDFSGNAYWNIGCSDGHEYSIQIQDNARGSTLITNCGLMKLVNVPCFMEFAKQR